MMESGTLTDQAEYDEEWYPHWPGQVTMESGTLTDQAE